jgi:hypothetical protein
MINSKTVPFPTAILSAKAAVNPRMAIFVDFPNTERAFARQQPFVNSHRVPMDVITFLKEFRGYFGQSDSVSDL